MKGLHLLIFGTVQGVFFRKSTQQKALALGLVGWVRNRKEGTVEVYAEGEEEGLISLLKWCGNGPKLAKVTRVDASWQESGGHVTSFDIRRTDWN